MMIPPPITLCLLACAVVLGWKALETLDAPPAASAALTHVSNAFVQDTSDEFAIPGEASALPPLDPALRMAALNRPLFSETRRRLEREVTIEEVFPTQVQEPQVVEAENEPQEEAPPPPLPSFTLSGVMVDGENRSALLSVDGKEPEWRSEGYEQGQWRILEVKPDRVVIRGRAEDVFVDLYPSE